MKIRKLLLSVLTIGVVGAAAFAATQAFFSDSETSTGNRFVAGDIDLQIDNESYAIDWNIPNYNGTRTGAFVANPSNSWTLRDLTIEKFFDFVDLKPGDYGEDTISVRVGSNDAWVCAAARITEDADNTITEPEAEAGDTTPLDGELDDEVNFAFWYDDGDNVYETGETIFLQGPVSSLGTSGKIALADSQGGMLGAGNPLPGNSTNYIGKYWCFGDMTQTPVADTSNTDPITRQATGFSCSGESVNNQSQTDSVVADIEFYAVQARNNAGFQCSSDWTPSFQAAQPKVGAALGGYPTPSCTTTVTGANSIQTAVSSATSGQTVCVDNTYTGDGDNTAIRIENEGVTLAATTQGVNLDVPVVLSNSNVTVTGFDGIIGQAESPAEQAAFYLDNDANGFVLSYNRVVGGTGAAILTETGAALGGGLITHNVLDGATQGMYLNPHTGTITVEYNDIDNNVAGIGGLNGAVVRFNEFNHTALASEAIGIDSTFDMNPATVNFNNFLDNMEINVYGTVTSTVDAENNFFNIGAATQANDPELDTNPETGSQYPHN